jgi:hypothetical protein
MTSVSKPSDVPPDLAAILVEHLERAEGELHRAIYALQERGEAERLHDWKRAFAHGMAALFRGLTLPLYRQHPNLAPEWIRSRPALPDEGDPHWFDFLLLRGRRTDSGEGTA